MQHRVSNAVNERRGRKEGGDFLLLQFLQDALGHKVFSEIVFLGGRKGKLYGGNAGYS
jgi:hypothetical protein